MIAIVKDNLNKIIELCERMQLQSLYLFGSATKEKGYTKDSDLDFLYQFKKGDKGMPLSKYDYFDLMFDLEKITGKSIDLVAVEKIKNKFFLSRINREKIKIYES
ncbi:MAG TPA: nucleotidyltransferase domain-containing protein [Chitinophagaceae bacterium]